MTSEGYIPAPGEIEKAEPIPPLWEWRNPLEILTEEEYDWVLVNRDKWKPRGRRGVYAVALREHVRLPGFHWSFGALAWTPEGKVYLLDDASYVLLHDSRGDKTAREIIEALAIEYIEKLPEDHPLKKAAMKEEPTEEDRELIWGLFASLYAQLAILKKYGLIT